MISTRVIWDSLRSKTLFDVFRHCQKSILLVRLFSSSTLDDEQSFTVSYLVNSCGLSVETAKSVSTKVQFTNPKKPDSVLVLLRSYGFTDTHVTKLVKQFPAVLVANSEKTLKPKLEFFNSIGISGDVLVKFVSLTPEILKSSLENRLIPLYKILKDIVSNDEKVVKAYLRFVCRYTCNDVQKIFSPNIAFLKDLGVSESSLFSILISISNVLFRERRVFEKSVMEVHSMGYDPQKAKFVHAMSVFLSLSKSTLEHKMEIYKSWGWSENDLNLALKNYPTVFTISEKNITDTMDFLINKMGYKSADIARYPPFLCYNLEARITPRCLVLKVLSLKGLIIKDLSLSTLIQCSANKFVEKFVARHEEKVPQLLKLYQGKISLSELGFNSEDVIGVKPS